MNSPITSRPLTWRFTALELACVAAWKGGTIVVDDQTTLTTSIGEVELPPHLRSLLLEAAAQGLDATRVHHNPLMEPQQVLLLVVLLLSFRGREGVAREFGLRQGLDVGALDLVTGFLERRRLLGARDWRVRDFLEPSDELWTVAQCLLWRLHRGAKSVEPLRWLTPAMYEHPWDGEALAVMRNTGGFDSLFKKFSEWHLEKIFLG